MDYVFEVGEGFSALPVQAWLLITIGGFVAALHPRSWRFGSYFTTMVHEGGHALAGLLVGRRITAISISEDMSGTTMSVGKSYGPGLIWTTWWGYPFPALVAWGLLSSVEAGRPQLALALLVLTLTAMLFLSRSLVAVGSIGLALALALLLIYAANALLTASVIYALGWVLLVGAVRSVLNLFSIHVMGSKSTGGVSDATALWELTFIPTLLWVITFAAAVGGLGYLSFSLVLEALTILV